jgi:hypothetical protein
MSEMAMFHQLSELNCRPAVSINFAQDRVVLVTTESETHTKLVRQPLFGDSVAIKFPVQEEVKRTIVPFDYFENLVCDRRVFSSSAHATPSGFIRLFSVIEISPSEKGQAAQSQLVFENAA